MGVASWSRIRRKLTVKDQKLPTLLNALHFASIVTTIPGIGHRKSWNTSLHRVDQTLTVTDAQ